MMTNLKNWFIKQGLRLYVRLLVSRMRFLIDQCRETGGEESPYMDSLNETGAEFLRARTKLEAL